MTKDDVIDLIKDAGYGVLATVDGNVTKARHMMPYLTDEGNLIVATYAQKRVVSQINANPSVEMCFIDRKMNFARVSGNAKITDEMEKKELAWNNLPMIKQFFAGPEDPNFVIIEIDSEKVEAMTPQHEAGKPDILSLK